jgi:hypothetical protein
VSITADEQEIGQGKQPVQALIRLWQARGTAHSEGNGDTGSRAQMLVEDVLGSTLEATTDPWREGYVCASGINNLSRTLAASRALQEAFEGFRATVPLARTTISVVIDRPGSGESGAPPSSPSLELTSLLDITSPGQVLITQSFYKSVGSGQALQLRSFPPRTGAYEWLWASDERLAQLQSDPYFQPTLVGEPRTEARRVLTPPSYPGSTVHLRRQSVEKSEGRSNNFHIGNLRPLHKISAALALALAVAVGVGTWWYMRPISRPTQPGRPSPTVVFPKGFPKGLETEMIPLGRNANIPLLAESTDSFIPKTHHEPKTQVRQGCSIADQIPRYLAMAESSRNRGQCDDAMRQYNGVLACEPGNREARQGLERVLQDKRFNLCR